MQQRNAKFYNIGRAGIPEFETPCISARVLIRCVYYRMPVNYRHYFTGHFKFIYFWVTHCWPHLWIYLGCVNNLATFYIEFTDIKLSLWLNWNCHNHFVLSQTWSKIGIRQLQLHAQNMQHFHLLLSDCKRPMKIFPYTLKLKQVLKVETRPEKHMYFILPI